MFSFIRNHQTVFQSGCTILHSCQQCMRVTVASEPCQHLVPSVFWILTLLIDVQWYLIVVLICISLMMSKLRHLFTCLFAICVSSLVRYPLRSLAHFLIELFVFLLLSFKSSSYILDNSPLSDISFANIFSQSLGDFSFF